MTMNKMILGVVGVVLIIFVIGYFFIQKDRTPTEDLNKNKEEVMITEPEEEMKIEEPELTIDASKSYSAKLMTSEGEIVIGLTAKETPITVNNFVYLARAGFYDGTQFHRVMAGFMIQGGDPEGTGMGGPGYKFDDEPFSGSYTRGTVAMANAGPDTNGSQFFIMHADYDLPPNYVIFGRVISGMEVVDKIATAETTRSASGEMSKPVSPVVVEKVEIVEE